eukprot:SAG11_NODE_2742_length_3021_cov_2.505476_3_plen_144_part_00
MEERTASRPSNCFAMNQFASGCVWPGPWCYYEVETARFTSKCAYDWVNPHVHPQTPHCALNKSLLSRATTVARAAVTAPVVGTHRFTSWAGSIKTDDAPLLVKPVHAGGSSQGLARGTTALTRRLIMKNFSSDCGRDVLRGSW